MPLFLTLPPVPQLSLTRGSTTLSGVSGSVTVTDSAAKTTSMIVLTYTKANTTSVGSPTITTKSNGSFVIQSTNVLDSSTLDYVIMN